MRSQRARDIKGRGETHLVSSGRPPILTVVLWKFLVKGSCGGLRSGCVRASLRECAADFDDLKKSDIHEA